MWAILGRLLPSVLRRDRYTEGYGHEARQQHARRPHRSQRPGARAAVDVWDGLAAELAELATLARRADSLEDFYPELLRRAVAALAAEGGAVWTPREAERLHQVCVIDPDARPIDHEQREAHERLLRSVIASGEPRTFAPHSTGEDASVGNSVSSVLVVAPVFVAHAEVLSPPAALLELALRPGASPSVYQGALDFLTALADVAAEFHAHHDLARLRRCVNISTSC